jgi:multidrug efflux pump subunit AcrA (membrane-fusion protein)
LRDGGLKAEYQISPGGLDMRPMHFWLILLLALPAAAVEKPANKADKPGDKPPIAGSGDALVVEAALVTLIEQVEVPARVEGVLAELSAREGQLVTAGDPLARIEDVEPALTLRRATFELDIARKQARSDIKIRVAKKAAELAEIELKRARESIEKYKKSVSETEIDRLRLAAEKALLDVDQTRHDQEVAELTAQLKETEQQLAESAVERRRIPAPLSGMVVQVNKHRGEWVEPGQIVLRLLRVDRLRVEGLVNVKRLSGDPTGRRATLKVDLPGRAGTEFEGAVVFVSPEVNPVNGQVRIWAEVENRDLALRPGLQGVLTVHTEPARTAKRE